MSDDLLLPRIAVLMGDAAGIGPETVVQAMQDGALRARAALLVIGSAPALERAADVLGADVSFEFVDSPDGADVALAVDKSGRTVIPVLDCGVAERADFRWGVAGAANGANAIAQITQAVELAQTQQIAGMVIGPLNKEAMHLAGSTYPDEIAFVGALAGVKVRTVVTWNGIYRSSVTGHVPLRAVPDMMTLDAIVPVIRNLWDRMGELGVASRRIGVAGLNPHAGEGGAFGDEEIEVITPAIEVARASGVDVSGPYPADTIFVRAMRGEFNGIVFMYHDQGNTPMKTAAFGEATILYSGLPFPCAGVSHGSAYDIAGTGQADAGCLVRAVEMVATIAGRRAAA